MSDQIETKSIVIRDIFGAERSTTLYLGAYSGRDGFACPFCQSVTAIALNAELACDNGWCNANPRMPVAVAMDQAHDAALIVEATAKRKRDHEWAMQRIFEERSERNARWEANCEKARAAGQCVRCASDDYRPCFVKHRAGHSHLETR